MKNFLLITSLLLISIVSVAKKDKSADNRSGLPMEGKMYFSNQPFAASNVNSKKSFSSSEYIYGRIELPSGTIKEAFKIKEDNQTIPSLQIKVTILEAGGDDEVIRSDKYYLLVKDEFKNGNALNFDILPEGSKAITLYSMLDDFAGGNGVFPLPTGIGRQKLPEGKYKIRIKIYTETINAYGSYQSEDKWPILEDEFDFKFSEDDVARISSNAAQGGKNAQESSFRYDKLPPLFFKPGKLTDPNASSAKIAAILKRDLPERQIIKWVAESHSVYWNIAKDDFGIPKYKYFNPHIWMAYKSNGKCYVGYVTLRQEYSGGGTYGGLEVAWTTTKDDKGIDCEKVK